MKSNIQRLSTVIGQIEGVKKMIENSGDCLQILTQLKASKSAINSVIDHIIEEKYDSCLNEDNKKLLINIKKYVTTN